VPLTCVGGDPPRSTSFTTTITGGNGGRSGG
jgi:hypothetical protein